MGGFKDKRFRHKAQRDRRVAGIDEIKERNLKEPEDENKKEGEGSDEEGSEEESEEEKEDPKVFKKERGGGVLGLLATMSLNDEQAKPDPNAPVELTRKERELQEAERKKRAYEKLQAEGKTDEAKADLERLAKIRGEREAAKKAREEEVAKKTVKENAGKANAEYVAAMRGDDDGNRMRGDRSKDKKKKDKKDKKGGEKDDSPSSKKDDDESSKQLSKEEVDELQAKSLAERKALDKETYATFGIGQDAVAVDKDSAIRGTIEACRAEEDDFM